MRATLVHNPSAGGGGETREALLDDLATAGFTVRYQSVKEDGCERVLQDPGDVVFVAGGDGTVFRAGAVLRGSGVPMVLIPTGTANNVACALNIRGTHDEILRSLRGAPRRIDFGRVDVGAVRHFFLESCGLGLFPEIIASIEQQETAGGATIPADRTERLARDIRDWLAEVGRAEANPYRIRLDGKDLSGRYLLVEILNFSLAGPGLVLGDPADPTDGRLDLVLAAPGQRARLEAYLERRLANPDTDDSAGLPTYRGTKVEIEWSDGWIRTDGKRWDEPAPHHPGHLSAELEPGAITIMVPT